MRLLLLPAVTGLLLTAFAAFAAFTLGQAGPARAAEADIEVDNFYFCDSSHQGGVCDKTVSVGDTVKWEVEGGTHTVTQCNDTFTNCPPAGGFDSGALGAGNSFSHVFDTPGVFAYECSFHPGLMRGRLTVQAVQTATPTAAPTASPTGTTVPTATAAPAAVPRTGGEPGGGSNTALWAGLVLVSAAVILTGAAMRQRMRRSAP